MNALLEISGLNQNFGGVRAVDDFSLLVMPGTIHGLIGPNGAGKTTIFNVITGLYKPSSGSILFKGEELVGRRTFEIANKGIGRTFQNIRLFPKLSVLENVIIAGHKDAHYGFLEALTHMGRYSRVVRKRRERSHALLAEVGLEDLADKQASSLPYGLQRRLEIARALAAKPKLLLLDEPAAGMNPQETQELMEMIRWIKKEFGLTILLIEHDMSLVMGICERIYVLEYGEIIAEGTPKEIKENPEVIRAYLGGEA